MEMVQSMVSIICDYIKPSRLVFKIAVIKSKL